jgi:transposase
MRKFIGLDIHSATFTMVVLNEKGKRERQCCKPTTEMELIREVGSIVGDKELMLEESHMAQWAKCVLDSCVDRLVVCDPVRNRYIAAEDFSNDLSSATKLAELIWMGKFKEIYHPEDGLLIELRRLFCHYRHLDRELTRCKNRLKATFRQVAVLACGQGIYHPGNRDRWLRQLEGYPALHHQAKQLYGLIDLVEEDKSETRRRLVKTASKHEAMPILKTCPGVGDILASAYIAIIATPYRFSRRNKLWKYASLGNVYHESDNVVYKDGSSRTGNRELKWVVNQHMMACVFRAKTTNRFKRKFYRLIETGKNSHTARRDVRRSILSSIRTMWMKGEPYRDKLIESDT